MKKAAESVVTFKIKLQYKTKLKAMNYVTTYFSYVAKKVQGNQQCEVGKLCRDISKVCHDITQEKGKELYYDKATTKG